MTWVTKMESVIDRHLVELRKALDSFAETRQEFDISQIINYFAYDIIGELAFSMHFNTQKDADPQNLPPINDHIFLGSIFGLLSFLLPYSRLVSLYIPSQWLQGLIRSRMKLRAQTNACVAERIQNPNKTEDLMSPLINTADPMTGRLLGLDDLATEAFGFL
jgi:benzoate 4-monooxygenase